jgi:uracil-DNA glycosylase family 4
MPSAATLEVLNAQIVACESCPRLREYCAEIARVRRRQWRDWSYWGRPVPSFGDPKARVLVFGLAPGAHGSNRTGRPFTGDGSGNFMFPILYEAGFASQPNSESREDGLKLTDMWISAAVRCAPPANKPTPEELRNCAHWLDEESVLLTRLRVVVCLGKIGFDAYVAYMIRTGTLPSRAGIEFRHGAEYKLPNGLHLLATYHPSLQNTNTGVLTAQMFLKIFTRARDLMELKEKGRTRRMG